MANTLYIRCILSLLFCGAAVLLHGCGGSEEAGDAKEISELKQKIAVLEAKEEQSCQEQCKSSTAYGRWHSGTYGHSCWVKDEVAGTKNVCICSSSTTPPEDCKESDNGGSLVEGQHTADMKSSVDAIANTSGIASESMVTVQAHVAGGRLNKAALIASAESTKSASGGSPRETVHEFCDPEGLKKMRGDGAVNEEEKDGLSGAHQLESAILNDVARELEGNNVDKMAKEIFTFYVCLRWVPDDLFFKLAEQEMAADLVKSIVDAKENLTQAVTGLYQKYSFVPLLCSKNLEVFSETDTGPGGDGTYFKHFEKQVDTLTGWLQDQESKSVVYTQLKKVDSIFCGEGKKMNDCTAKQALADTAHNWGFGWVVGEKTTDKWDRMHEIFRSFEGITDPTWKANLAEWKQQFPYHSFIDKPNGMGVSDSPRNEDRYLICFGKRVASEMHRRPNGQHILTDQNNMGCHGWWNTDNAVKTLQSMVQLWRPPTCQLADMTYHMKKEILKMFVSMNERLFDALPTMLMDEEMESAKVGKGEEADELKTPMEFDGFYDNMRVAAKQAITYKATDPEKDDHVVPAQSMGTVDTQGGKHITVEWDYDSKDKDTPIPQVDLEKLKILPMGWKSRKGLARRVQDAVAGMSSIADKAKSYFSSMMMADKQKSLGVMMSDSVSKWIVCPVKEDADMERLDSNLGVEDSAFQDFRKEAYSKWTGYEAQVPGEKCEKPAFMDDLKPKESFKDVSVCEISELHADHVEKYTIGNNVKQDFICPIKPALPFDQQLSILAEKKGTCYLRMTETQAKRYQWIYNGDFPARKQNERQENIPKPEYELIKLLNVPEGLENATVSFGRLCSLEEYLANPRFCESSETHNPWPTVEEMANHLAGTVVGSLGVAGSALTTAIASYQKGLTNGTDRAKETLFQMGEQAREGLFGAARLLGRVGDYGMDFLQDDLPGKARQKDALEHDIFGKMEGGSLLNKMSFQRDIGENGKTSNAKARFQRYVVTFPCSNYDPAMLFSQRREWGAVARRLVKAAEDQAGHYKEVLSYPTFEMLLRGEAYLEEHENSQKDNSLVWKVTSASIQLTSVEDVKPAEPKCETTGLTGTTCAPNQKHCYQEYLGPIKAGCYPKTSFNPKSWHRIHDKTLANVVGGAQFTDGKLDKLHGIKMKLYCGKKKDFGRSGPPEGESSKTLLKCLEDGVAANAKMHASEPWRLYFPDEVVAVAIFEPIEGRWCEVATGKKAGKNPKSDDEILQTVCSENADKSEDLVSLFKDLSGKVPEGINKDRFRGVHTGSGYPKGAPTEVLLKPEDILEAVGDKLPDASFERGSVLQLEEEAQTPSSLRGKGEIAKH